MFSYSRAAIAGVTFAVAGGTGYYLQSSDASVVPSAPAELLVSSNQPKSEFIAPETDATAGVELGEAMAADTGIVVQDVEVLSTSASDETMPQRPDAPADLRVAALENSATLNDASAELTLAALSTGGEAGSADTQVSPSSPDCEISLSADVEEAAMVHLYLDAPCRISERVTIQHEAMAFTAMTTSDGLLDVVVPALSETGIFYAFFGDSEGAMIDIAVPGIAMYDRVALLWKGDSGLQVHAREFGADYGTAGHVWSNAPRSTAHAVQAQGGFLTTLGDSGALEPQMAEVYTFPSGMTQDSGTVRLSVEAEITAANCGRDVSAVSLQSSTGGPAEVVELELAVPGCQTIGDFLVLNSLLRDLKVAGN